MKTSETDRGQGRLHLYPGADGRLLPWPPHSGDALLDDDGSDSVWLMLQPRGVHLGPITGTGNTISIDVGLSGEPRVISQRLQFIHLKADGTAADGGSAP